MRPRAEQRTLDALDRAIRDLPTIRDPFLASLARDDEDGNADDRVRKDVRKLAALVTAVSFGVHLAKQRAKAITAPPIVATKPGERTSALSSCIVGHDTSDNLRRGMCDKHRQAYKRSEFVDVAEFIRHAHDEDVDG